MFLFHIEDRTFVFLLHSLHHQFLHGRAISSCILQHTAESNESTYILDPVIISCKLIPHETPTRPIRPGETITLGPMALLPAHGTPTYTLGPHGHLISTMRPWDFYLHTGTLCHSDLHIETPGRLPAHWVPMALWPAH